MSASTPANTPFSPPTPTRPSWAWARWWAFALLLLAIFAFAPAAALADAVDDQGARIGTLESELDVLKNERTQLEGEYAELTQRIEALKASGSLVGEGELQELLTSARSKAERLNDVAAAIERKRDLIASEQDTLIDMYDARIAEVEAALVGATDAAAQQHFIAELEALQAGRDAARRARKGVVELAPVEVPDVSGLDSDDPEEILAAVDELADSEEELAAQLAAIEEEIESLEDRRRLIAYAEDTSDEAQLFREEARSTKVQGSRSSGDAGARAENESTGGAPTSGNTNDSQTPPADSPTTFTAEDDTDGDGLQAAPTSDPAAAPESNADLDGAVGRDAGLGAAPDGGDGGGLKSGPSVPPTSSGSSSGVVRSDADTNVVAGRASGEGGDAALDQEIKRLKKHRKKVERSIDGVRTQRERLRERAKRLGAE